MIQVNAIIYHGYGDTGAIAQLPRRFDACVSVNVIPTYGRLFQMPLLGKSSSAANLTYQLRMAKLHRCLFQQLVGHIENCKANVLTAANKVSIPSVFELLLYYHSVTFQQLSTSRLAELIIKFYK